MPYAAHMAPPPAPHVAPALAPSAGEVLVNFVCRLVGAIGAECGSGSHMCTSALALAAGALKLFPGAVVRMTYLPGPVDKYAASIVTSAPGGGQGGLPPQLPPAFDMGLVAAAETAGVCVARSRQKVPRNANKEPASAVPHPLVLLVRFVEVLSHAFAQRASTAGQDTSGKKH